MTLLSHADYERIAANLSYPTEAFIGGTFAPALSGETMPTVNPATGKEIARVASCGREDVDKAVAAARKAFESGAWSRMHPSERKKILMRFIGLIEKHQVELAVLESLDSGKPVRECLLTDLPETIECLEWHAECADKQYGGISPSGDGRLGLIVREPAGVVACVLPWNFPLMMVGWKLGPALAEGNSVILKPASVTSLSTLKLAEFAAEAGIPEGVFNVITGPGSSVGEALGLHPGVDVVSFTGSTEVGRRFLEYAARSNLKRIVLELGGKSPVIVDKTADLKLAARRIAFGKVLNAGQTCVEPDYLLIDTSVKDAFVREYRAALQEFFPDGRMDEMPVIVSEKHFARVTKLMEGQNACIGGTFDEKTRFVAPTLLDGVSPDSPVMQEEIFGPILPMLTFDRLQEAIDFIRGREKPLALYLFTSDRAAERQVLGSCSFGGGCINDTIIHLATTHMPFGGVGHSGMGSYHGKKSFETFTHARSIVKKATWLDLPLRYHPYSEKKLRTVKKFMK